MQKLATINKALAAAVSAAVVAAIPAVTAALNEWAIAAIALVVTGVATYLAPKNRPS